MTLVRLLRPLPAVLLLVSLLAPSAAAQSPTYDSFYVFGDSLADNGNVWLTSKLLHVTPPPPPSQSPNRTYFDGRFSNGPVAFEYLWERVRKPGAPALVPYISSPLLGHKSAVNFAFGGTGTPLLDQTPGGLWAPGLLGQVELFRAGLRGRTPSGRALYAIVTGANDYRIDDFNVPMSPVEVVANIVTAVRRLHQIGARDILLLTLPNLGCTPGANLLGSECIENPTPPYADPLRPSELSAIHNALLAKEVAELNLSGLRLRLVNVNAVFTALRAASPGTALVPAIDVILPPFRLPNGELRPMSACLFIDPAYCVDVPAHALGPNALIIREVPAAKFLFWDILHPTTDAHRALGQYLYEELLR